MLLEKQTVLVTGAARGIGAECAKTFAENGASEVIIVDVDETQGKKTEEELNKITRARFIKADVSSEADILRVFEIIENEYEKLDVLMNVAGICSTNTILIENMKGWDKMMDINLKGTFLFMRGAYKLMQKKRSGRIISISSISGQVGGIRTSPAYAASKSGILSLTKSFAKLGAKENITANAIAPGIIDTEMTRDPDFHCSADEVPMGRLGTPRDVANAALFLASDLAAYITGQCINVNGGMYLG